MKLLVNWFNSLNRDSRFSIDKFAFEDPGSTRMVCTPFVSINEFDPTERITDRPRAFFPSFQVPCPSIHSEATKTLSVVIPAYNEEDRLPSTLDETMSYLQRRRDRQGPYFTYEVIVVDDGSIDGTARTVFSYIRKHGLDAVRLLKLPMNRGKGYAVKSGALCSRGQSVLLMDADGATTVSEVERLESELERVLGAGDVQSRSLGFILGSRAHLQETTAAKRTALRNFLMHGFHLLVMAVVGAHIRDTQCGFKLYSRQAAKHIFSNQRLQRWCFDVEHVLLAQRLQIPMAEVGVAWTEIPGSKIRITSMFHMAFELVLLKIGYTTGIWRATGDCEEDSLLLLSSPAAAVNKKKS